MARSRQDRYDALTTAISRVLTPVMICMVLAIWFVHGLGDPNSCKVPAKRQLEEISLQPNAGNSDSNNDGSSYSALLAGIFVGVFVVLMVLFTFILVWLYKSGRRKVIFGWLLIAVFMIFAYVGGLYIFDFCRSHCINLDWITLSLAVWNFTITGLFAVFGVVPRIVNQAYLIVMSALMAYIFRTLPSWAIWTILGILVVWDLFAVLSKYGPLKMLVDAARDLGDPLPALVYDTNPNDAGRDDSAPAAAVVSTKAKRSRGSSSRERVAPDAAVIEEEGAGDEAAPRGKGYRKKRRDKSGGGGNRTEGFTETAEAEGEDRTARVGTLGAHLKLGLGDFVFYSILVAQASKSSAMTAITSFVAILAGLCATLFLVTVCRKALPALPISISAGLLFYVLTRYTVQPFVANLLPELLFH